MQTNDASNRSWRTLLQGAVVVALVALGSALLEWLNAGDFTLRTLGVSALTAVLTSVLSYVHRRVLDPLEIPTAIPPADPGLPATFDGRRGFHRERDESGAISVFDALIVVTLAFVVLAILVLLGVVQGP